MSVFNNGDEMGQMVWKHIRLSDQLATLRAARSTIVTYQHELNMRGRQRDSLFVQLQREQAQCGERILAVHRQLEESQLVTHVFLCLDCV